MSKKDRIEKEMKLASLRQQIAIEESLVHRHQTELAELRRKLADEEPGVNDRIRAYVQSRSDRDDWYRQDRKEHTSMIFDDGSGFRLSLYPSATRMAVSCTAMVPADATASSPELAVKAVADRLRHIADKMEDRHD